MSRRYDAYGHHAIQPVESGYKLTLNVSTQFINNVYLLKAFLTLEGVCLFRM